MAFIADSISSGLVMREVIERSGSASITWCRSSHLALGDHRGLTRIARSKSCRTRTSGCTCTRRCSMPAPDFYYSAHFDVPELHIRPDLEKEYRQWWGQDAQGNHLADTACAGYGWSEVFYSPRKQIQMINDQLRSRHALGIADVVRRNII